jgi:hypothetical protein
VLLSRDGPYGQRSGRLSTTPCYHRPTCSTEVSWARLIPRPPSSPSNSVPEPVADSHLRLFDHAAAQNSPWCLPRTELKEDRWRKKKLRGITVERPIHSSSTSRWWRARVRQAGGHARPAPPGRARARRCVQGPPAHARHSPARRRSHAGHHRARLKITELGRAGGHARTVVSAGRGCRSDSRCGAHAAGVRACGGGQSKVQRDQSSGAQPAEEQEIPSPGAAQGNLFSIRHRRPPSDPPASVASAGPGASFLTASTANGGASSQDLWSVHRPGLTRSR